MEIAILRPTQQSKQVRRLYQAWPQGLETDALKLVILIFACLSDSHPFKPQPHVLRTKIRSSRSRRDTQLACF
jgi:hypothetical protein